MYTRVLVEALFVFRSEPDLFKHYIKKNFNERIINKTKDFLVNERIIKNTQSENDNELSIVELFHLYIKSC